MRMRNRTSLGTEPGLQPALFLFWFVVSATLVCSCAKKEAQRERDNSESSQASKNESRITPVHSESGEALKTNVLFLTVKSANHKITFSRADDKEIFTEGEIILDVTNNSEHSVDILPIKEAAVIWRVKGIKETLPLFGPSTMDTRVKRITIRPGHKYRSRVWFGEKKRDSACWIVLGNRRHEATLYLYGHSIGPVTVNLNKADGSKENMQECADGMKFVISGSMKDFMDVEEDAMKF